jgi:hypothetical protein
VGGERRTLLWRPAGGQFRLIDAPDSPADAAVRSISMPASNEAWLATSTGEVFAGTLSNSSWTWKLEDLDDQGGILTFADGRQQPLNAIAVDASGRGFAVGGDGVILQRTPTVSGLPWKRVASGVSDELTSVAIPAGGGSGALAAGPRGLVLTSAGGRFEVAQPDNPYDPSHWLDGGVAMAPGDRPGQVEAWAGIGLHYSSDPSDPLLDADQGRVRPLPDSPPAAPGEISFAAFGKSDCLKVRSDWVPCPELTDSNLFNEQVQQRIVEAVTHSAGQPGGPQFSVFTGDAGEIAGAGESGSAFLSPRGGSGVDTYLDQSLVHRRWSELVARPLTDAGVPVFGALGSQDLSQTRECSTPATPGQCEGTNGTQVFFQGADLPVSASGVNLMWRQAMAEMPAPWGAPGNKPAVGRDGTSFTPLTDGAPEGPTITTPQETVTPSVTAGGQTIGAADQTVGSQTVSAGGAHTHYAFDVVSAGRPVLRMVFVDTSMRTLSGAVGVQNPIEEQLKWLTDVLSSRPSGERAVVVSETPSYSYGPGASSDTLGDSLAFETLMAREQVSAVISGRLGWNGVYYTSTAVPGLHCPQPGGSYPDPSTGCSPTQGAGQAQSSVTTATGQAVSTLESALGGTGAPSAPPPDSVLQAYPTVIAASAGGKFGPLDGPPGAQSGEGFWHGYSLVRIMPNGAVVVEQRPILDWIGIQALTHTLQPGQHMTLHGFGREPVGMDTDTDFSNQPPSAVYFDQIDSPAITHRYDLVQADPARPYLPKTSAEGNYVPLDPSIASVDKQTGYIRTGSGAHPRVYAIAILSVGNQAASWPLVFEPSRSYASRPPVLPQLPPVAPPATLPPAHLAAVAAAPPAPPTNPPPAPPEVSTPSLPQLPALTPPPPVAAVTPPNAPPPPAPPPPPSQPTPLPLALQAKLSPVGINATVVPPAPPPVNPAPPSGSAAKKEARQKQAATAKSEEGAGREAPESGDLAAGRPQPDSAMTRRGAEPHPMTRLVSTSAARLGVTPRASQPSAWARDLAFGGGLGIAALVLALGFSIVRPTPRRRSPELPAPAWARRRVR